MKTIHIANETDGSYNVHRPLPCPFHIEDDGSVARQDFWRGEPLRLLGFQEKPDVPHIHVRAEDWLKNDTDVRGHFPVFLDADGSIWSHRYPVEKLG